MVDGLSFQDHLMDDFHPSHFAALTFMNVFLNMLYQQVHLRA